VTDLLLLLGIGAAALWGVAVAYVAWMLTHPPRRTYAAAVARGRPGDPSELALPRRFETWTLEHAGLRLPVWDIPGDDPAGPVVVLIHGWADSRIGGLARIGALAPVASRVILWDLPGHGIAPGTCSLGLHELEFFRQLIATVRGGGDARAELPLVLFGWSLGAGLALAAAAGGPSIAAVIAESPYRLPATPARNVLRARALPWRLNLGPALFLVGALNGDPFFRGFDRAPSAARVRCPILILHGAEDAVSPMEDARAIAAAAPRAQLVEVPGAGHNNLWTDPAPAAACTRAVREFLGTLRPTLPA
jgi:pimeloyl-ACP methyl ester carboxylesterase